MLNKKQMKHLGLLITGGTMICLSSASHAIDSMSVEIASGNETKMLRLGAQWEVTNRWWESNGTHIGAYWDLTLAQWREERFQNQPNERRNITDIGITPVFRFQNDNKLGLYGEVGIGAHFLSGLYDNNGRKLSTHFQFGDHLGIGYVFSNKLDIGLKFQHFSNGGYKQPNNGVNFGILQARYTF